MLRGPARETVVSVRHRRLDLELRHTFRLARGASDVRSNLIVELEEGGFTGLGEAAPLAHYGQDWRSAARAVDEMAGRLGDVRDFESAAARAAVEGEPAAEAAVDMALRDLAGKRLGLPLWRLMDLPRGPTPPTSFTIALDTPEVVARKVREAGDYEILKVKLGAEEDRAVLEAVRDETDRPVRVDANEGWTLEEARERLEWLAGMGVELVEQPLPADRLEEARELRRLSPLPIVADESAHRAADVPRLAGAFDGINIKLMKCGGLREALRMIRAARAHGMKVMLGCMIESSLAITAAAHLAPLADWADLDGNLLVTNDPFVGAVVQGGRLVPPEGPGLGVVPAS